MPRVYNSTGAGCLNETVLKSDDRLEFVCFRTLFSHCQTAKHHDGYELADYGPMQETTHIAPTERAIACICLSAGINEKNRLKELLHCTKSVCAISLSARFTR